MTLSATEQHLKSFAKSLKERLHSRRIWAEREGVTAYRLFDREHAIPLSIDIFNGKYLHVTASPDETTAGFDAEAYLETIGRTLYIPEDRIFYKERVKLRNREQYRKVAEKNFNIWTEENGLFFKVNLSDYIDTGLFLDHRRSRSMIAEQADGRNVLNLFCYTGSFSVYAAFGGAAKITSVDLSSRYIEWAAENMQYNGFGGNFIKWIAGDVFEFLEKAAAGREKYDIIILDPPVFSNSRSMEGTLNIQRDYARLINSCLKIVSDKGFIFFSTPLRNFDFSAKPIDGVSEEITRMTVPYDFRRSHPHRTFVVKKPESRSRRQRENRHEKIRNRQRGTGKKKSSLI
jgi:23S rRNA (cytosine1962-C5)-methyltransferase